MFFSGKIFARTLDTNKTSQIKMSTEKQGTQCQGCETVAFVLLIMVLHFNCKG